MKTINVTQAADMLQAAKEAEDGRIFSVVFIKRTTGERREMLCKFGVTKHLAGGELKFDPASYALITVFDMQKEAYRSINLNGILIIKMGGEIFEIQENKGG